MVPCASRCGCPDRTSQSAAAPAGPAKRSALRWGQQLAGQGPKQAQALVDERSSGHSGGDEVWPARQWRILLLAAEPALPPTCQGRGHCKQQDYAPVGLDAAEQPRQVRQGGAGADPQQRRQQHRWQGEQARRGLQAPPRGGSCAQQGRRQDARAHAQDEWVRPGGIPAAARRAEDAVHTESRSDRNHQLPEQLGRPDCTVGGDAAGSGLNSAAGSGGGGQWRRRQWQQA